jgi:hypothetical protein
MDSVRPVMVGSTRFSTAGRAWGATRLASDRRSFGPSSSREYMITAPRTTATMRPAMFDGPATMTLTNPEATPGWRSARAARILVIVSGLTSAWSRPSTIRSTMRDPCETMPRSVMNRIPMIATLRPARTVAAATDGGKRRCSRRAATGRNSTARTAANTSGSTTELTVVKPVTTMMPATTMPTNDQATIPKRTSNGRSTTLKCGRRAQPSATQPSRTSRCAGRTSQHESTPDGWPSGDS